jgi:transcriptional regulator with XRE-family HTH domain
MLERTPDRSDLAAFLRTRRARLRPADVGLAPGLRRRTSGLRREEVAQLAGIGVTWYTWLEQGRNIGVSREALLSLAKALRLNAAETAHLCALGQKPVPPVPAERPVELSQTVRRIVDAIALPAYVKNERWDLVAWNRAAAILFIDYALLPEAERNVLWLTFMSPVYRRLMPNWAEDVHDLVARFRVDFGRASGGKAMAELCERLTEASPEFRTLWPRHEVVDRTMGRRRLRHPLLGVSDYDFATFAVEGAPGLRMIVFTPVRAEVVRQLAVFAGLPVIAGNSIGA